MPSDKPKCPECGEVTYQDIKYEYVVQGRPGPGTISIGLISYLKRSCKKCGASIYFDC